MNIRHRSAARSVVSLVLALWAPTLLAHDFWIEPATFAIPENAPLAVRLRVGEHFAGDPVPRDPRRIVRFVALGSSETEIAGRPGSEPAGLVRLATSGLHVLAYESNHATLELDGPKFEKYLREEGLERISAQRARAGQADAPSKEIYLRCAKALVAAGEKTGPGHDRVVGLPLELIPDKNPLLLVPGSELPLRLLYKGAPLSGAKVFAVPKSNPDEKISARTDSSGRVLLKLARGGVFLIKAVHMVAAPKESGADWESFWASLTFEVPASK